MHKAKNSKVLIAVIAAFTLAFGGLVAYVLPATAVASLPGCEGSDFGAAGCVPLLPKTAIANISVNKGTAGSTSTLSTANSCVTPNLTLNRTDVSGALVPVDLLGPSAPIGFILSSTSAGSPAVITATFEVSTAALATATTDYILYWTCTGPKTYQAFSFSLTIIDTSAPVDLTPATQTVNGTVGTALNSTALSPANFVPAPTLSVTSGTLPAGLTFDATTRIVSGTPTTATAGTTVTITATNVAVPVQTDSATITFVIVAAASGGGGGAATPEADRKVTICHRTHATTNPYVRITVDYNSVNKKSGHQGHDEIYAGEHVFKAGIYKRAKDKDWGDIIPADPSGQNRWQPLNWTALGEQIYNGTVAGCPTYNPVTYYNALREAGVPEKKIKQELAELEAEQNEALPSREKKDPETLKYTGSSTKALEEENDKVTICHATNATTNPYRKITVSSSSITNKSGHYGHDDIYLNNHVYDATVTYPANQKDWGDIIPADPTGKERWKPLNWTALGQKIYSGAVAGCSELDTQTVYNLLRESGLEKKEIKEDLEKQKNIDDDPKDVDDIQYTGTDPKVEETEPREPKEPAGFDPLNQSLSGIVWLDLNRDGLKDSDEPYMPNITMSVGQVPATAPASTAGMVTSKFGPAVFSGTSKFGSAVAMGPSGTATVKSDINGFYLFSSLPAGDWRVLTAVPEELLVTYDSAGAPDGYITTTVPVSSHAFTWVGLVSIKDSVNKKLLEEILMKNPEALPLKDVPTWLKSKVQAKLQELKEAESGDSLAATGSDLSWLYLGLTLLLASLVTFTASRRARRN